MKTSSDSSATPCPRTFVCWAISVLALVLSVHSAIAAPQIRVVPSTITTVTLFTNQTTTRGLTVYNDGSTTLIIHRVYSTETASPILTVSQSARRSVAPPPKPGEIPAGAEYVPGELLVKYKTGGAAAVQAAAIESQLAVHRIKEFAPIGVTHVRFNANIPVAEAIRQYMASGAVEYAEPNYIRHIQRIPNDTRFNDLWGMHNTGQTGGTPDADIDAPEGWDIATDAPNVVVGLIDTGIDYNHPDLAANIWTNPGEIAGNGIDDDGNGYVDDVRGYDFVNNDNNPMDDNGHGSHTAGTIGAVGNNGTGVAGVCWRVKIMALKAFDAGGNGPDAAILAALLYANAKRVHLTSNSWGGGGFSQSLQDAIYAAGHTGALFINSSGNSGSSTPQYPSNYPCDNIIVVMAIDHNDAKASFSNWGTSWVDLAAPGVSILSCQPGGNYQYMNGTSMACPHVAGVAALLWGYVPRATSETVKRAILDSVRVVSGLATQCATGGVVNLPNALNTVRLYSGPAWLETQLPRPLPLHIPPGGNALIIARFIARVPQAIPGPGRFFGQIILVSDDPAATETRVAATMQVNPAPELDLYRQVIDDDAVAPSNGDGDGYAEPGETLEIWVDVVNRGFLTAQGVASTFSLIGTPPAKLTVSSSAYPDIPTSETRRNTTGLVLTISGLCPDGTTVGISGVLDDSPAQYGPWPISLQPILVRQVSTISGQVTDQNTGLPVEGIEVTAGSPMQRSVITNSNGDYRISGLVSGTYNVAITNRRGYSAVFPTSYTLTVPPDRGGIDFKVLSPEISVTPTSFTFTLRQGQSATNTLQIANTGSAVLNWRVSERLVGGTSALSDAPRALDASRMPQAGMPPGNSNSAIPTAERAPQSPSASGAVAPQVYQDIHFNFPLDPVTSDFQNLGVEFDGTCFYITGGNNGNDPNKVYVLDRNGNFVRSFNQTNSSGWGWRDLAWDGQYLYGSDDGNVSKFQTDGTYIGDFPGPGLGVCRGLAYDPATDHFWSADYDSNIFEFTRTGAVVHSYLNTLGAYGLAWDNVSPDGPWLWVFSQDGGDPRVLISQFNPRTGTYTGKSFLGWGNVGDIAGGACFTDKWDPDYGLFVGLTQGDPSDRIVGYEITPTDPVPWLNEKPGEGATNAGATSPVAVGVHADLAVGVHRANLLIRANDVDEPVTTVSVTVNVTPGDPEIGVAPRSIDFGIRWLGQSRTDCLTVRNTAYSTLTITTMTTTHADYRVTSPSFPIQIGWRQQRDVLVRYMPSAVGTTTCNLVIQSNAVTTPVLTVALRGTGVAPPAMRVSPTAFTTVTLQANKSTTRALTVYNDGGATLTVQAVFDTETAPPRLTAAPLGGDRDKRPPLGEVAAGADYVPDEVLVKYKANVAALQAHALDAALGAVVVKTFPEIGWQLMKLGPGVSVAQAVRVYADSGLVEWVEPNYKLHIFVIPNDPNFSLLWGLHNTGQTGGTPDADIDAPEAWDLHTGNQAVVVAVIDTGVDYTHPDLAANMWQNPNEVPNNGLDDDGNGYVDDIFGYDFVNTDANPMDDNGHGTHCAGTIGAVGNNGVGVVGVNWRTKIMPLKVFDASGSGDSADIISAILYARRMGAKVLSNSYGGGTYEQSFKDAIDATCHAGMLFVAAAGNNMTDNDIAPVYPASYSTPNIIAVAATDNHDDLAPFSNVGATSVDLGAPGEEIFSTFPGGNYQYMSGTSMATPHVAGAAALLWSSETGAASEPVKRAILNGARPLAALAGKCVTGGVLNLPDSLNLIRHYAGPAWLTETPPAPLPFIIPPGGNRRIVVNWNAQVPNAIPGPGVFFGQVHVQGNAPNLAEARVKANMVVQPVPELHFAAQVHDDDTTPPSNGDNDGHAEPGEIVEIWVDLVNQGWLPAQGVTGNFWLGGPATSFTLSNLNLTWPNIAPGETRRSNAALRLTIAPSCPNGTQVVIHGSVNDSAPEYGPWQIRLTTITIQRVSTVRGTVTDENTGQPTAGVTVTAEGMININMNTPALKVRAETQPSVLTVQPAPWIVDEAKEVESEPSAGVLGSGGPDAFGYAWKDSDDPGGPAYSWIDITKTGTVLPLSGDDALGGPYPIGITFPFYGGKYTQIKVSTNGWITFGDHGSSALSNLPLPNTNAPPLLIAALWDDLICPGSSIYTWSDGTTFIISFINVRRYGTTSYYTFQIILNKDGRILLQYQSMTSPNITCTVGIQNADKTIGLQVVCDAAYLKNNLAVEMKAGRKVEKTAVTGANGAYEIRGLPDTLYTITARKTGYTATIPADYRTGVPPDQNGLDFRMLSPLSQITPTSFTFVLDPDQTQQKTLTIGNNGSDVLQWVLYEQRVSGLSGLGAANSRNAAPLRVLDSMPHGSVNALTGAFRQPTARIEPASADVLVYTDDPHHTSPGNYVDQALQALGIPYTGYYNGAFSGFETALNTGGPWRLVIFNNENNSTPQSSLDALNQYVANGGKLIAACWRLDTFPFHPLWTRMGIAHVANDSDPPDPVYWWQPAHAVFNQPRTVPEFTNLTGGRYQVNGQHVSALAGATALAGYSSGGPQPNEAALVFANAEQTLFRAFTDGINDADRDSDGVPDGVELWINTISYIYDPIPWLTETRLSGNVQPRSISGTSGVVLTANTAGMAVGTYRGQLKIQTNDFRAPATTIPCHFDHSRPHRSDHTRHADSRQSPADQPDNGGLYVDSGPRPRYGNQQLPLSGGHVAWRSQHFQWKRRRHSASNHHRRQRPDPLLPSPRPQRHRHAGALVALVGCHTH
ncbi:MAG: S8 family serine peptidase [Candidatus Sumerlaeia bacterium]|nr:S8 family serine peptidase [Candidatus Sumerlaeia bacterium]